MFYFRVLGGACVCNDIPLPPRKENSEVEGVGRLHSNYRVHLVYPSICHPISHQE